MKSLQTICAQNIADASSRFRTNFTVKVLEGLPRTILPNLLPFLSASDLHELQPLFEREGISTEETWRNQLAARWGMGKRAYKATDVFGEMNCPLHGYYMSKHVMDLISYFVYKNPIDPKLIFTTRLDKISSLRLHDPKNIDEDFLPSSMDDLLNLAGNAYMFHLYSQAQVNFLMDNWKVVERLSKGVAKLIIHHIVDSGYQRWKYIIRLLIENGSVDHVVVIFPRLAKENLQDLIFCCAGLHPNVKGCSNSNSIDTGELYPERDSSTFTHVTNTCSRHSGVSDVVKCNCDKTCLEPSSVSSLHGGGKGRDMCRKRCASESGLDSSSHVNHEASCDSLKDKMSVIEASGSSQHEIVQKHSERTGTETCEKKRKIDSCHEEIRIEEPTSPTHVRSLNSSDVSNMSNDHCDVDIPEEDLFDEALMLPVAHASPVTSCSQKNSLENGTLNSVSKQGESTFQSSANYDYNSTNSSNSCSISSTDMQDSYQFKKQSRGVRKFVLSHSFLDSDSDGDPVAVILSDVLQRWPELTQFAMMHVYTVNEIEELETCYVQLLDALKNIVMNGQLTRLVLQDTKMPWDNYTLPLLFKRSNLGMEPLKMLNISNIRNSRKDLDIRAENEMEKPCVNIDSGVDYVGASHLKLLDSRTDSDGSSLNNLLTTIQHDQCLKQLTWHNEPKIRNEEFVSVLDAISAVNRLEYLEIRDLLITSIEREEALVKMISNTSSLRVLNLIGCDLQLQLVLSDGFIGALATSNIRELCLSDNKLGDKVLVAIVKVLQAQQPDIKLTNIDLSENCLTVDGLLEFAEALENIPASRNQCLLHRLTIDENLRTIEEQTLIQQVFATTVRDISAKIISNYSRYAEFEAQM